MLKLMAEISEFTGDFENLETRLQNLYDSLIVSTFYLSLRVSCFIEMFWFLN